MDTVIDTQLVLPRTGAVHALPRFRGPAGAWLSDDPRRHVDAWQVEVRLGRLRQPVLATAGRAWEEGTTTWRTLRWTPVRVTRGLEPTDRLPDFEGRIGLERRADDRLVLHLVGSYEPPAGRLGSVLDALLLHKVAEVTAHQLVADVVDRLVLPDVTVRPGEPPPAVPPDPVTATGHPR